MGLPLEPLVEPAWASKVYFAHTEYLKKAKLVVGTVTGVSPSTKEVTLADGTVSCPYDFLVVATGFGQEKSISLEDKIASVIAGKSRFDPVAQSQGGTFTGWYSERVRLL